MTHLTTVVKRVIPAVVVPALLLVGCANMGSSQSPRTLNLAAQNNSGENGTVTLTPVGDKTEVTIKIPNAPAGVAQPAHIHAGTCANLDPKPKHGLANVVNGSSVTTVPVALSELLKGSNAINVHKSTEDLKTYVACADIK